MLDDKLLGGAMAKADGAGNVTDITITGDLDGDGNVDTSDEQIIRDIANAFLRVKW